MRTRIYVCPFGLRRQRGCRTTRSRECQVHTHCESNCIWTAGAPHRRPSCSRVEQCSLGRCAACSRHSRLLSRLARAAAPRCGGGPSAVHTRSRSVVSAARRSSFESSLVSRYCACPDFAPGHRAQHRITAGDVYLPFRSEWHPPFGIALGEGQTQRVRIGLPRLYGCGCMVTQMPPWRIGGPGQASSSSRPDLTVRA